MSLDIPIIDFNDIVNLLIDERMKKEEENPNEKAKEDYEKLKDLIDKEKNTNNQISINQQLKEVDDKIEERKKNSKNKKSKETKTNESSNSKLKTWSSLNKESKEKIIDEYIKENKLTDETLKLKIMNGTISSRNIKYDKVNQKIISIKL